MSERAIARRLALLSTQEIASALHAGGAPRPVRALLGFAARLPSERLGRALARFDRGILERGLSASAASVLHAFGARTSVTGSIPSRGGVLVVTNHPGAFDALALLAAFGRDDVALVAAERAFLRAMPALAEHLVFVDEAPLAAGARASGLRRAFGWLRAGHVLVQFGAGTIEPDPKFDDGALATWSDGTGLLAGRAVRIGACVVPALVSGVHSPRAKRLRVVRWAERRGITTIAPLIQATVPGFRDVEVAINLGPPLDDAIRAATSVPDRTAVLRSAVARLWNG